MTTPNHYGTLDPSEHGTYTIRCKCGWSCVATSPNAARLAHSRHYVAEMDKLLEGEAS